MPSNKRPSNPLALAILVHLYEQPRHPYELASTLRERRKEKSIRLNYGSLYTVIESLERDKHVRAIETKREGNRPEKTVYEITPAGEALMLEWMRELLSIPVKEYPQFEAALSLLPVLPPEEVVPLLEGRLRLLKKTIESFDEAHQEVLSLELPRLFSIEDEYHEAMILTEYGFVESLLRDIRQDAAGLTTAWKRARKAALASRRAPRRSGAKKPRKRRRTA
jgi:DNA-binding PadR family transcriptional regulator